MNRTETVTPANTATTAARHGWLTARVVVETVVLFVALAALAHWLGPQFGAGWAASAGYAVVLLAQGLLLQRIYIVAHEAAHKKIAPRRPALNDGIGQALLLTILVPLQIYRKIHVFHHGFNRRDPATSALDVFVSPWPVTPLVRAVSYALWYLGIFAGGWFLHSLVSIVLFLCMPTPQAQRLSPAFKNWNGRDRLIAWAQFLAGVALHLAVAGLLGGRAWLFSLGLPLLAFAWIWSLLVYVFHYHTTLGAQVRFNVRAIRSDGFFRWLLLNFNEHATHHMYPNIPWYELPARRAELPAPFAEKNQTAGSLWRAVLNQLQGPTVVYAKDADPAPHLFVHWED